MVNEEGIDLAELAHAIAGMLTPEESDVFLLALGTAVASRSPRTARGKKHRSRLPRSRSSRSRRSSR